MGAENQTPADAIAVPSDTPVLLQRILRAVENSRRQGRLELVVAIVLSVSTLASNWCGYQSRQWGGAASNSQAGADTAERQAAENTITGLQLRTQDGLVLLEYWRALRQGDTKTTENIYAHLRPHLRQALQASIAAGVLENPEVPGPLQRPEYSLAEEREATRQRELAQQLRTAARDSGHTAGTYVVLTLMFASVLFFGGISGTFTDRRVRTGLACMAVILFGITLILMLRLPTYRG